MNRIIILNEELESQMRMYLALSNHYRVEIAEDEPTLMRMIRRKKPKMIILDSTYSGFQTNGKSFFKTLTKIRKKYSELKIMTVCEADAAVASRISSDRQIDGILMKPFDETDVLEHATTLLPQNKTFLA